MATSSKILGEGIYGFTEAGRLTRVHPQTVRAWFRGRKNGGIPVGAGPVFESKYGKEEPVISFLDLIEVLLAGHLRMAGVSLSTIRKSYESISNHLADDHPFSRQELVTDGENIFLHGPHDDLLVEVIKRQHFFHKIMKPYLERVDYDPASSLAKSWRIVDGIVIDPSRSLGKPVVSAAGIPASILSSAYFANGRNAGAVANWYGVAEEDVELAARFTGEVLRAA